MKANRRPAVGSPRDRKVGFATVRQLTVLPFAQLVCLLFQTCCEADAPTPCTKPMLLTLAGVNSSGTFLGGAGCLHAIWSSITAQ
jgi:hypothetical protein